ncbi:MAG TPA: ABC transporter permease [Candidatus Corynebacterium avicola]|uniref:ABC transporter permease n=1 Tax=Candidatus Corynebacterium avicola TaxID=2838527 RepID=A0A9D1RQG0_9CORY|nr:ABC transporter permease [Candidatus Corynebacterium avicola]
MTTTTTTRSADTNPGVAGSSRRLFHALTHGRGLVGLILFGVVVIAGLLAPVFAPYAPDQQITGANLLGPSGEHWFGTDTANQDLFSRTLYGIRANLLIIFLAVPLGAVIGTLLGLTSAQWRWTDSLLQRTFDLILAFPTIILAIALTMILGSGLHTVFIVVALAEIPVFGRLTRSVALSVRERPYVDAARTVGASDSWILRNHILPNSVEPLIVQLTLAMSVGVFVEGAMSFLGLGVVPPTPSLGSLIQEGAAYAFHAPFYAVGPLVVVVFLTLGLLLISQALSRASHNN